MCVCVPVYVLGSCMCGVCVVCAHACVCTCICVCVCALVCACVCMCVCLSNMDMYGGKQELGGPLFSEMTRTQIYF